MNLDRVIWPLPLQVGDVTRMICLGGSALVHALDVVFTSHFLETPEHHPRLHKAAFIAGSAIGVSILTAAIFFPYSFLTVMPGGMLTATLLVVAMVAAASRARARTVATYVVIAVPFLACLLLTNVSSFHMITEQAISNSLTALGLTFLVVGIAFGLAKGFRLSLEARVRERTTALSVSNKSLREAY